MQKQIPIAAACPLQIRVTIPNFRLHIDQPLKSFSPSIIVLLEDDKSAESTPQIRNFLA